MISWGTITYGALLSGVAAVPLVAVALRERRPAVLAAAALAAVAGPLAWNAILRDTDASGFVEAPDAVLPASRQDTGSGVFALAAAAKPHRTAASTTRRALALLSGPSPNAIAAFLVHVYLY